MLSLSSYLQPCSLTSTTVKSIQKKYEKALKEEEESRHVFAKLDSCIDFAKRKIWSQEEKLAMENCGKYLQIYQVDMSEGQGFQHVHKDQFIEYSCQQQDSLDNLHNVHHQKKKCLPGSSMAYWLSKSSVCWLELLMLVAQLTGSGMCKGLPYQSITQVAYTSAECSQTWNKKKWPPGSNCFIPCKHAICIGWTAIQHPHYSSSWCWWRCSWGWFGRWNTGKVEHGFGLTHSIS